MQEYLSTMEKPDSSREAEFKRIKRKSPNFFLEAGQLKRTNNPNPQLVISSQEAQSYILKSLHEDMGHRGGNENYSRIKARFWWEGMKKLVKKWVQSCLACQKRSQSLQREPGKSTATQQSFNGSVWMQYISNLEDGSTWLWPEMISQDGQKQLD
ncbi:hypothetical protein O181_012267 [Austropuccinia psidii MF-1]|uniref:Integrase zinc-binding domain-containing protein n=1 Tax=Austropuccinia psidii MF-1 TaxID=1389203 RepID=A0A9Q3BW58_9BASI|nr:hypothetical protein [Austropuccinia psidii MF-1]